MRKVAFAAVAALLTITALFVGLASPPATGQTPTAFRFPLLGEPPHIDPLRMADFGSATVTIQVYSTLVTLDDQLRIAPLAAKSWTVSRDGLVYTFKLRDNLVFHNGRKADANDVKYSLTRLVSPDSRSPSSRFLMSDVVGYTEVNKGESKDLKGITVIDPLTVEIRLSSPPRNDLLMRLTHVSTAILAREAIEQGGTNWAETHPIGTGPWRVKEWAHRSKVVFEAFPQYFEGKPKVDRLEMPIVPEPATQLAMYQNGELDAVIVPPGDYLRLKADPRWSKEMRTWARSQVMFVALNPRVYAPFKDVRVRQAFAHAIDKQKLATQVFHGIHAVAAGMIPPGVPGYDANHKGLEYNPKRAKELLAEAGFPEGRGMPPLTMSAFTLPADYRNLAEPISGMLTQNLGVNVEMQLQEFASFIAAMYRRDVMPMYTTGWTAAILDPNYFHDLWLHSQSSLNPVNYNNPAFDRLVDQANASTDRAKSLDFFRQADDVILNDVPIIPILHTRFVYLVSPRVKGLQTSPTGLGFAPIRFVEVTR
jgi:oligopeptide transport system substrate-binding protein